jgi:hypothetical protein
MGPVLPGYDNRSDMDIRANTYADRRARNIEFQSVDPAEHRRMTKPISTEVTMIQSLATRVTAVATTVLGLILGIAGRAAAMYPPPPDPVGRPAPNQTPTSTPALTVVDGSPTTLQWVVFVAMIVVALAAGAALMHLVNRRARGQLA